MSAYAYKNKAQSKSQQRAFFGGSVAFFSKPGTCTGFARHRLLCMGGLGWFRVIKVPPGPAGSRSVRRPSRLGKGNSAADSLDVAVNSRQMHLPLQ